MRRSVRGAPALRALSAAVVAIVALVLVPASAGTESAPARASGALELRGALSVFGASASRRLGDACAPGTEASVECFDVTGSGSIRGLGRVSVTSLQFIDTAPTGCAAGDFRVLASPMRLSIAGKGTIEVSVGAATGCRTLADVLSHTRDFRVIGGTGLYSGATGAGSIRRQAGFTSRGSAGTDTWDGTVSVPGLEFDLVPPVIRGATAKTVRAPRGAVAARVRYVVKALDDRDGALPVACKPRSGTRFRVGRTRVTCAAADTSGNSRVARFLVTVRRAS